jgi:hypothetical protein
MLQPPYHRLYMSWLSQVSNSEFAKGGIADVGCFYRSKNTPLKLLVICSSLLALYIRVRIS